MAIKPILFNSHMVRAILDGRKTVTRQVVKVPKNYRDFCGTIVEKGFYAIFEQDGLPQFPIVEAPYAHGDVLWVRETWAQVDGVYYYRADDRDNLGVFGGWCPSIHMPREAARIFLRVTRTRVERLQEIDEAGAETEGGQDFSLVWDKTIKPRDRNRYGWKANPWVWVIEFERCEKPEKCDD